MGKQGSEGSLEEGVQSVWVGQADAGGGGVSIHGLVSQGKDLGLYPKGTGKPLAVSALDHSGYRVESGLGWGVRIMGTEPQWGYGSHSYCRR